ncbi:hypothetical protein HGRIS_013103 [Hohenbuehelia grisea]|uniref:Phytocyanin domain-containing protein n=1 Tax=Hohenbuehelia grisea TaxID=104357 RepID=A0ABR3IUL0_9AGAR
MVQITSLFGAAILFAGVAVARPADSAINEPAVSAPDGTPITEVVSSTASSSSSTSAVEAAVTTSASSSWDSSSSNYGSKESSYGSKDSSYGSKESSWDSSKQSSPSYGSGSSSWGNDNYNDCVNKCVASYGAPAYKYQPTATSGSEGSTGTGATHTVIVAPSQGVLRYIPFALNASVGDTVKFMWGANNHTVTKGTQLTPCNKSGDAAFFASGTHDKDFVFTQVVNDTNPLYFYCATPGHCTKGMFGIINPPSALNNPTSVSGMMSSMVANSSDMAAMAADSNKQCAGTKAANWGGSINLAEVPEWARPAVAENVLYTRNFLAANQDLMKEDGSVDLSAAGTNPLMIPQDITVALSSNNAASPSAPAVSSTAAASASASPTAVGAAKGNGAGSLTAPRVLVGAMVVLATFFAL